MSDAEVSSPEGKSGGFLDGLSIKWSSAGVLKDEHKKADASFQ